MNFLGVMTRVDYFEPYLEISGQYPSDRLVQTEYPIFDEEYFEWIDLLESVAAAKSHFTMLELGAGYGRWTANAASALKQLGNVSHTLIAVEAEPTHFEWMVQHLADNSVDSKDLRLIKAAVAPLDGTVGFYIGEAKEGGPRNWYGQYVGGPGLVDSVSLNTLLQAHQVVDLIDLDVQGVEFDVLGTSSGQLDEKVKRVHIGTHGPKIEDGLRSLFERLGWKCLYSFPCGSTADTEWGPISFQDGVQTWLNPTYSDAQTSGAPALYAKLRASHREGARLWYELMKSREELAKLREEIDREHELYARSSGRRFIERCRRVRDHIAPTGTRRRRVFDLIANKI